MRNVELKHECCPTLLHWNSKNDKKTKTEEGNQKKENILLLLLKKVGSARLEESDVHPISPKTLPYNTNL